MVRGFHFGFEGCGGAGSVVLSLRREGTYTVSPTPSEPRKESPSEPRLPYTVFLHVFFVNLSHLVAFSRRAERFGDSVVLRSPVLHLAERLVQRSAQK